MNIVILTIIITNFIRDPKKKKNLVMKTLYSEFFLSYNDSILTVISILSLSSIKDNYFIFIINNDICIII